MDRLPYLTEGKGPALKRPGACLSTLSKVLPLFALMTLLANLEFITVWDQEAFLSMPMSGTPLSSCKSILMLLHFSKRTPNRVKDDNSAV